jgi:hypothetical protein
MGGNCGLLREKTNVWVVLVEKPEVTTENGCVDGRIHLKRIFKK